MARDKRGQVQEPQVDEALADIEAEESGGDFIAGPTSRNEAGDIRRAAAKAIGTMGASKKIDPELAVDPEGDRPRSGSRAGLHSFQEVPSNKGEDVRVVRSNEEIADKANVAARKAPAARSAQTEAATGFPAERASVPPRRSAREDSPRADRPLAGDGSDKRK